MSTNDNKEKDYSRFGGRVAEALRDEAQKLQERGYSQADIYAEGIRSLSDKEGLWRRRRDFAVGVNPTTDDGEMAGEST